jgi:hypothetical protein
VAAVPRPISGFAGWTGRSGSNAGQAPNKPVVAGCSGLPQHGRFSPFRTRVAAGQSQRNALRQPVRPQLESRDGSQA